MSTFFITFLNFLVTLGTFSASLTSGRYRRTKHELLVNFQFIFLEDFIPEINNISFLNISETCPRDKLIRNITFSEKIEHKVCDFIRVDEKTRYVYSNKETTEEYCNRIISLDRRIAVYTNMYVVHSLSVADNRNFYIFVDRRYAGDGIYKIGPNSSAKCIGKFEEVIAFGHIRVDCFGHWFVDALIPLMLLPESVLFRSKICTHYMRGYYAETLTHLGVKEENIIYINDTDYCIGRIVYSLIPYPHLTTFGYPGKILWKKIRKAFSVDEIKPDLYAITNRAGIRRSIPSDTIEAIFQYVKLKYSEYNWTYMRDNPQSVQDTAIFWAHLKFAFAPTGSNLCGLFFMNQKSVIVVAQADINDICFQAHAAVIGIYIFLFAVPGTGHHATGITVSVPEAKRGIDIGMYMSQKGNWPPHNDQYVY